MARIIVLGGGVCGLAAGMLLARDGHEVTLLERDPAPVPGSPEEAWENWERDGVTQFRQAHYLHVRASWVIATELPEIREALEQADAAVVDHIRRLAAVIPGLTPRPEDDRLVTLTARRPTVEQIFGAAADEEPRLDVRRGVSVERLVTGAGNGVPHVTGVRLEGGGELTADLVVDAMGRRSVLPKWLEQIGAAPVDEEAEDSGFIYYTRFFESANGDVPAPIGPNLLPIGSFSILTLPSDRGTWSVTLYMAAGDQPLKALGNEEAWMALVRSCPLHAHWLDGNPVTGVLPMGGVIDRYRRFVADGRPVATGVAAVGDAWACTNPSLGRGISLGLAHAALLRDVVRSELDGDPLAFAEAWDEATEQELTPWYRDTVAVDRARIAEIEAIRNGLEPPGPPSFEAGLVPALFRVMAFDPELLRAGLEITGCVTLPEEVFARPGVIHRLVELAEANPPQPPPGPTREELLRLVADAQPV